MVRILFVHPDLGIGGAERLVVDAAVALQNKGHSISFLTNHHDPGHCFEETKNGTFPVTTVGDWLPRTFFGKFTALCAYIRFVYAALYTSFYLSKQNKIDVIFCDQISIGIPIFRLAANKPKVLFYCHFPDQLLSYKGTALKDFYRSLINFLEEKTTSQADRILVNSKFTRRIFRETFKTITTMPTVLYPSLNTDIFDRLFTESITNTKNNDKFYKFPTDNIIFLSVNRYERKKNLPLALKAFKLLEKFVTKLEYDKCQLVMAGGYDLRVDENLQHYDELIRLAAQLNLTSKILFLQSPSDLYKCYLLSKCEAVLYTPENEHFGIVPVESMYLKKPVIAVNSGGPTETIIHNSTGFLCEKNDEKFAEAMANFVKDRSMSERMGIMGNKRILQKFSFNAFTDQLALVISELFENGNDNKNK